MDVPSTIPDSAAVGAGGIPGERVAGGGRRCGSDPIATAAARTADRLRG